MAVRAKRSAVRGGTEYSTIVGGVALGALSIIGRNNIRWVTTTGQGEYGAHFRGFAPILGAHLSNLFAFAAAGLSYAIKVNVDVTLPVLWLNATQRIWAQRKPATKPKTDAQTDPKPDPKPKPASPKRRVSVDTDTEPDDSEKDRCLSLEFRGLPDSVELVGEHFDDFRFAGPVLGHRFNLFPPQLQA